MNLLRSTLFLGFFATVFSTQAHAFCFLWGYDLCSASCQGETARITPELVKASSPTETVCALVQASDAQTLDALLKSGVDVNARTTIAYRNSPAGRNALFRVITNDSGDTFKFLLANHIDVNVQDSQGMTPLMEAAWAGRDGMVKELIKNGALPNLKTKSGDTALCYAQRPFVRHQQKIIDTLKNAGGTCE
ncbi:MAG: ankyrin repeat domain-containing protein [Bdellovibrionia bacterium]